MQGVVGESRGSLCTLRSVCFVSRGDVQGSTGIVSAPRAVLPTGLGMETFR